MIAHVTRPGPTREIGGSLRDEVPDILPRIGAAPGRLPSPRPALVIHRGRRPSARDTAHSALMADTALRGAGELLAPEIATFTLRHRMHATQRSSLVVQAIELLEHVAGHHCTLRFDVVIRGKTSQWHGIIHAEDRSSRTWLTHRRLWNAGLRCVPEPLGVVPERHLYLERRAAGIALTSAMGSVASTPRLADAILRALNATAELPLLPAMSWTAADAVRRALPREARSASRATRAASADRLTALTDPLHARAADGVILRELPLPQLVLSAGRIRLCAIEHVALGDPAHDVGTLIGGLLVHGWRHPHERAAARALASALLTRAARLAPTTWHPSAVSRYACLAAAQRLHEAGARARLIAGRSTPAASKLDEMMVVVEREGTLASHLC